MKIIISTLLCINCAYAYEYPYNPLDKSYIDKAGSVIEIVESTPIKSQDGIGLCYGFSSTTLLESYRCKELKLDCSNPHEALSTFDISSFYGEPTKSLTDGGFSYPILKKISQLEPRSVAREECIPFTSLANQNNNKKNEGKGWKFLIAKWNEYKGIGKGKKSNDCVVCLTKDIKTTLGNLKTPADQISDAFTTSVTMEEFLYKAILPKECLIETNKAVIPPFIVSTFPEGPEVSTEEMLQRKIEDLLTNKIPLEITFCADDKYSFNCKDQEAHSVALYGIKDVCKKSGECRKMTKIKNSYGKSWMDKNNNGWVDLKELVRSSYSVQKLTNITWISRP